MTLKLIINKRLLSIYLIIFKQTHMDEQAMCSKEVIMTEIDDLLKSIGKKLANSILISSNRRIQPIPQPASIIGGRLKDYQLESLAWMAELDKNFLSGILADDMGLGKTIQTIAYLGYINQTEGKKGKHLIVVPKNVLNNWKREFEKWDPNFSIVILPGTEVEREECLKKYIRPGNFDVLIATYQSVQMAETPISKFNFRVMVIDEAHSIKNDETYLACCLRRLKRRFSLLLTGTPLSNELKELWSLLNFVAPDIFLDDTLFRRIQNSVSLNCSGEDEKMRYQSQIAAKFKAIISPFLLRRVKSEINLGLKQKKEFTLFVSLTELQLKMYRNMLKYHSVYGANCGYQHGRHVQLRKICAHPYTFSDIEDPKAPPLGEHLIENSGKMKLLDKLLTKLLKEKHKILIFSQFITLIKILEDYCTFKDYKYSIITGDSSLDGRDEAVQVFSKDPQVNIFLISTRAGGIGLNLVAADVVIIYDLDWNPQMDRQATDRAYRIGQKNSVKVFRFVTNNTVEQRMLEVQKYKLIWDELVIQKGGLARMKAAEERFEKIDHNHIAGLGAEQIFNLQQNYDDKTIDEIIRMGEQRDKKKTEEIRAKLQKQLEVVGENMNPYAQLEALNTNIDKIKYQAQVLGQNFKRKNTKLNWKERQDSALGIQKNFIEPKAYHLFKDKQEAGEILFRIQESQGNQEVEKALKQKLRQMGFYQWTLNQFSTFLDANLEYMLDDYKSIAKRIKTKSAKQVQKYSKEYFSRAEAIPALSKEYKKIMKKQEMLQKDAKLASLQDKIKNKIPNHLLYFKPKTSLSSISSQSITRMYLNGLTEAGICLEEHAELFQTLNPEAFNKSQIKYMKPAGRLQFYSRVVELTQQKIAKQTDAELDRRWDALINNCSTVEKKGKIEQKEESESVETVLKV